MTIYVDATALVCSFIDRPEAGAWREWLESQAPPLATSQQVIAQLRADMADQPWDVRMRAFEYLDDVEVLRISDQALKLAAFAHGVLTPFEAISIGIARATEEVTAFATYQSRTAAVAHLHGLTVVAPGRAGIWWE